MIHETYPELFRLFAGYFHQDWALDDRTTDDVFRNYIATSTVPQLVDAVAELDRLLAEPLDEVGLHEVVWRGLVLGYDPTIDGLTLREWLEATRRRISDAVTYEQQDRPPTLLPGPTAWHWLRRATISFALGAVCAVGLLVGSTLDLRLRGVVIAIAVICGCACGIAAGYSSWRQIGVEREERDAGYTTLYGREYRRRWHLDPKTGAVIRPPESTG